MAMDHFLEEVVVKKERTMNEILYVLSMVVVVISGVMGLISLEMLMVSFSVGGLLLTVVNIGVAVVLFLSADGCGRSTSTPSPTAAWISPWCSITRSARAWAA